MMFQYVSDKTKIVGKEEVRLDPPEKTTVFGVTFELDGEPKEVPEQFVNKFRGNPTFVEVFEGECEEVPPNNELDLSETYKILTGEDPDRRWGEKRLQAEIEKLSGD